MISYSVGVFNDKTQSWVDYTKHAVMPLKFADLLDEQLDEAELTLKAIPVEYFQPLTIVKIDIHSQNAAPLTYDYFQKILARAQTEVVSGGGTDGKFTQHLTRTFVVANDTATEIMGVKVKRGANAGKSVYNHQIYLIEITKTAEGFIGDALTYTNALGNDYIGE